MSPEDTLQESVQAYLRETLGEDRIVTAYVVATESVTLQNAGDINHVDLVGIGTWATRIGLAHVLLNDVSGGDDG